MSDVLESLNGLIIPLAGKPLLLPNVAVAELVAYRLSQSASSGPEWFLGWTLWRDQQVPMVDLDNLLAEGAEPAAGAEPRTLILNALDGVTNLRFIGVRVWGIPRAPVDARRGREGWGRQQLCITARAGSGGGWRTADSRLVRRRAGAGPVRSLAPRRLISPRIRV